MSDNLLLLHQPTQAPPLRAVFDAVDYCQCDRGPVIGVVTYTESRMWFFPVGTRNGDNPEGSPELCCVDCLAETAQRIASGAVLAERQAVARERAEETSALRQRSQISVADWPRQTSPSKGDQVT
ncbi:hypothetical protein ACFVS9_28025 [Streptomyces sp. NPDC058008]|uniref:hypothetical protein n=1 Tax=Streptomyces sp. NPDC058008 TaxID=3346303 RepID=UPI0036E08C62